MVVDDAGIANAEAKLHYNFWRPITAIRNASDDGNDATAEDPAWEPLIATPNHPEYPCAHCTFAGAVATVLKSEVGDAPPGGVRVHSRSHPQQHRPGRADLRRMGEGGLGLAHLWRRPLPLLQRGGRGDGPQGRAKWRWPR